jgi:hypothetical protein
MSLAPIEDNFAVLAPPTLEAKLFRTVLVLE